MCVYIYIYAHMYMYMYITNCRHKQYCFGLQGLIRVVLMLGWGRTDMITPNDPIFVVSCKPRQSVQTR